MDRISRDNPPRQRRLQSASDSGDDDELISSTSIATVANPYDYNTTSTTASATYTSSSSSSNSGMNSALSQFMSKLLEENQTLRLSLVDTPSVDLIATDNAAMLPDDFSCSVNLRRLSLPNRNHMYNLQSSLTSLPELSRWDSHVVSSSPSADRVELSLKRPQRRVSEDDLSLSAEEEKMILALPCLRLLDSETAAEPQHQQHPAEEPPESSINKRALPPKVPVRRSSGHRVPSPPPFDPNHVVDDNDNGSDSDSDSDEEDTDDSLLEDSFALVEDGFALEEHYNRDFDIDASNTCSSMSLNDINNDNKNNSYSSTDDSDDYYCNCNLNSNISHAQDSLTALKLHHSSNNTLPVVKELEGSTSDKWSPLLKIQSQEKNSETSCDGDNDNDIGTDDIPSLEDIQNPPHLRTMKLERQNATRNFQRNVHPGIFLVRQNASRNFVGLLDNPHPSPAMDAATTNTAPFVQDTQIPDTRLSSTKIISTAHRKQKSFDIMTADADGGGDYRCYYSSASANGTGTDASSSLVSAEIASSLKKVATGGEPYFSSSSSSSSPVTLKKAAKRGLLEKIKNHIRPTKNEK